MCHDIPPFGEMRIGPSYESEGRREHCLFVFVSLSAPLDYVLFEVYSLRFYYPLLFCSSFLYIYIYENGQSST